VSGQYRSHVWSKLLIEVEGGNYSVGAGEEVVRAIYRAPLQNKAALSPFSE
jgi:hypothetical protein